MGSPLHLREHVVFLVALPALFTASLAAQTQPTTVARWQISGGVVGLSNSFNGVPGEREPLLGWDAAVAFPAWHALRFKVDVSGYNGRNLGASQQSVFILAGAQYEHALGRERLFAQALFGDVRMTRNWGPGGQRGNTASFAALLGGGLDTPLSRQFAVRVEADMQHTNLAVLSPPPASAPYKIPGLPTYFGRFSAGLVWTPGEVRPTAGGEGGEGNRPESEVAFQSLNSFGHIHIFGNTWRSYLHVAGVEYDRPAWGRFLGARMYYAAEVLPVVLLRQPSSTTVWGNPYRTYSHTTVPGFGISPVGLRLLWNEGGRVKPYFTVMGGMIGFTQKALSQYASYENFSLQEAAGFEVSVSKSWDLRAAISDFHFSNAFIVPSDPGIDEMSYTVGLSHRFATRRLRF